MDEGQRTAPAVGRNRQPILDVLKSQGITGLVLEIASGTGEHAVYFARELPGVRWQPTDCEPAALASIAAWREAEGPPNLLEPIRLDAEAPDGWPVVQADAVVAINMIHISPWQATLGLMAGAARLLPAGGLLLLYGPFREGGRHTAESNAAFHADLQARNPAWGVRDLDEVTAVAAQNALLLEHIVAMPANNLSLCFRRR